MVSTELARRESARLGRHLGLEMVVSLLKKGPFDSKNWPLDWLLAF